MPQPDPVPEALLITQSSIKTKLEQELLKMITKEFEVIDGKMSMSVRVEKSA